MTEAIEAPSKTTRTHDLHTYKVLSPDWLTKHEPRTLEHMVTHPDEAYEMSVMSEIGDGVFVAWSKCRRCTKHYTVCTCADGPQEPQHVTEWRTRRFAGSFDARPDLGVDREVVTKTVKELRERGYAVHDVPEPVIKEVEVTVPDHSLFLQLFKAAADCEAPEGTQLDDVLATFQEAYDQFAGRVSEPMPLEDLAIPDLTEQEADDFMEAVSGEQVAEGLPEPSELEQVALAPLGTAVPVERDLDRFDDDF